MMSILADTFSGILRFIEQSVADISEPEMLQQPTGAPNHAIWTLGHCIASCQGVANELGAESWLPAEWEPLFGYGSVPASDPSHYPTKSEMLRTLRDSEERLRQILLNLTESAMKQPRAEAPFPTTAHLLFQVVIAHTAFHAGQLAAWRRAIGRRSAAVFV